MAPHSEEPNGNGVHEKPIATHNPGLQNEQEAKMLQRKFPTPPVFQDKYKEREYLKGRLAAAFRIFGKYGFDEGVAGHITLRVSN
jgi:hypothetical protein